MSTGPIAAVDTGVLVMLVGNEESKQRTETCRARIKAFRDRKFTLWVPAPSIAELAAHGSAASELLGLLAQSLGEVRVADFSMPAAEVCGRMLAAAFEAARRAGTPYASTRAAMKFDAMIAAIADSLGAKYLLTADAHDIGRHLKAVGSLTEIHRADQANPTFAWQPELPGTATIEDENAASAAKEGAQTGAATPARPPRSGGRIIEE